MTPALQQAIRLLQLSSLELHQEINQCLESNLVIELDEDQLDPTHDSSVEAESSETSADDNAIDDIPETPEEDYDWQDVSSDYSSSAASPSDDYNYESATTPSLQQQLRQQADLAPFNTQERVLSELIIDALDDDGYLRQDLGELGHGLGLNEDERETVLKLVQRFDPVGIAARSLTECLERQLLERQPTGYEHALLLLPHLEKLVQGKLPAAVRNAMDEDQLDAAKQLIRTLNPRPSQRVGDEVEHVIPDVRVQKFGGKWRVLLNGDLVPKLRVNEQYCALAKQASKQDGDVIRSHMTEARWLIKSLQARNETLLKVATAIVDYQQAFFDEGPLAIKPLVLRDIAETIDMHESTVSRVTTNKYMATPRGLVDFKYFFSSNLSTSDGGDTSAVAIQTRIKQLVDDEPPEKPLSDSKLAKALEDDGFKVARRTIAKYREALNIPPSHERKTARL